MLLLRQWWLPARERGELPCCSPTWRSYSRFTRRGSKFRDSSSNGSRCKSNNSRSYSSCSSRRKSSSLSYGSNSSALNSSNSGKRNSSSSSRRSSSTSATQENCNNSSTCSARYLHAFPADSAASQISFISPSSPFLSPHFSSPPSSGRSPFCCLLFCRWPFSAAEFSSSSLFPSAFSVPARFPFFSAPLSDPPVLGRRSPAPAPAVAVAAVAPRRQVAAALLSRSLAGTSHPAYSAATSAAPSSSTAPAARAALAASAAVASGAAARALPPAALAGVGSFPAVVFLPAAFSSSVPDAVASIRFFSAAAGGASSFLPSPSPAAARAADAPAASVLLRASAAAALRVPAPAAIPRQVTAAAAAGSGAPAAAGSGAPAAAGSGAPAAAGSGAPAAAGSGAPAAAGSGAPAAGVGGRRFAAGGLVPCRAAAAAGGLLLRFYSTFPQRHVVGHRIEIFKGKHRRRRRIPPRIPLHPLAAAGGAAATTAEAAAGTAEGGEGRRTWLQQQQQQLKGGGGKDMSLFEAYADLQLRWKKTCRQRKKKYNIARKWRMLKNLRPLPAPCWTLVLHCYPRFLSPQARPAAIKRKTRSSEGEGEEDAEDNEGSGQEEKTGKREKVAQEEEEKLSPLMRQLLLQQQQHHRYEGTGILPPALDTSASAGRGGEETEEKGKEGEEETANPGVPVADLLLLTGEYSCSETIQRKGQEEDWQQLQQRHQQRFEEDQKYNSSNSSNLTSSSSSNKTSSKSSNTSSSSSGKGGGTGMEWLSQLLRETPQEELFCVMKSNVSTQHKVTAGDLIQAEKLHRRKAGDRVVFATVLLVGSKNWTIIGKPTVPFAKVEATVEEQTLTGEQLTFFYRKSRRVSRFLRVRHWVTMLRVDRIVLETHVTADPPPPRPERLLDLWANRWLYPEEKEGIERDADGVPVAAHIYDGRENQKGLYQSLGLTAAYRWHPDPQATHWRP